MINFDIELLSPALGAEIKGLDLRNGLAAATIGELRTAELDHIVLLFRGQDLSEADEVRVAGYFGEPFTNTRVQDFSETEERNPHVLPIFRGLMSTIYCDLKKGSKKDEIINALKKEYSDKVFIDILNHNIKADFFSVCNTNKCLIKLFEHNSDDKIIIVSLIDNLLKGAGGQAIQCMNLMFGLEDQIGLV